MAGEPKDSSKRRSEERASSDDITIIDAIKAITRYNANADIADEHQLTLFLQNWWCRTYNKPYKDPLFQTYTLEELLYEFFDRIEREKSAEFGIEEEADRIEDKKIQSNLDWAEEQERQELEQLRAKQDETAEQVDKIAMTPSEEPENKAWMEEVIKKELEQGKKLFGEDFGEDINEDFE